MRIADIQYNDMINGEGVCISIWCQGCVHSCPGCHNPELWDFNGGYEINDKELCHNILTHINDNNIQRNLSILGGEPLCEQNIISVLNILAIIKKYCPNIKTYVWTGYTIEELIEKYSINILNDIDVLIDGKFILKERDITLHLRGSRNQRILRKNVDF